MVGTSLGRSRSVTKRIVLHRPGSLPRGEPGETQSKLAWLLSFRDDSVADQFSPG